MVELDSCRTFGDRHGARFVGHHGLEVEDLEDAVEADERGHDVDLDVREGGQRAVQTVEVCGQGDDRPDFERTVGGKHAAPAVYQCRGE